MRYIAKALIIGASLLALCACAPTPTPPKPPECTEQFLTWASISYQLEQQLAAEAAPTLIANIDQSLPPTCSFATSSNSPNPGVLLVWVNPNKSTLVKLADHIIDGARADGYHVMSENHASGIDFYNLGIDEESSLRHQLVLQLIDSKASKLREIGLAGENAVLIVNAQEH